MGKICYIGNYLFFKYTVLTYWPNYIICACSVFPLCCELCEVNSSYDRVTCHKIQQQLLLLSAALLPYRQPSPVTNYWLWDFLDLPCVGSSALSQLGSFSDLRQSTIIRPGYFHKFVNSSFVSLLSWLYVSCVCRPIQLQPLQWQREAGGGWRVQKSWRLRVRWLPFFQALKWEITVCPCLLRGFPPGETRSGKASPSISLSLSLRRPLVAFNLRQISSAHTRTHTHIQVGSVFVS